MQQAPEKEHEWLQQLVGEWIHETDMEPWPGMPTDQPMDMKPKGRESVRSLGGLWVVCEGQGETPGGGQATTLMTIGFDPGKKRYTGSWVGSMMTHLWVYDGELDATGKQLVLSSEGPSMSPEGGMGNYRDVIEILGPNERTLTAYFQDAGGEWKKMMQVNYRRK